MDDDWVYLGLSNWDAKTGIHNFFCDREWFTISKKIFSLRSKITNSKVNIDYKKCKIHENV